MYNYSKDGVVVSTVLGARTINKEGKYPVKIKGYYQKRPKYDSIGICMTKEEWNKLPDSKSFEYRKIKQAIESCFSLVRMNVEALVEKGIFSFNTLNLRLGKATGDTLNSVIRAKIEELRSEDRIGTMQFFKCTLVMVEEVGGKDIPFSAITVEWLQKCEKLWSKTKSVSTIGMHMRNIRTLMNEAKRAGVSKESQYPFGKGLFEIKTGIGRKKGLTKKLLKVISDYKSGNKMTNRYKDFWIFIYEQEASVSEPITQEEAAENTPEKREYTIDELIDMLGPILSARMKQRLKILLHLRKKITGKIYLPLWMIGPKMTMKKNFQMKSLICLIKHLKRKDSVTLTLSGWKGISKNMRKLKRNANFILMKSSGYYLLLQRLDCYWQYH